MSQDVRHIGSRRHAPLLPRGEAREGALFMVMVIICTLACLSLLGARAAYRAADNWTASLQGSMTIRLMTSDDPSETADALVRAEAVLKTQPGILRATGVTPERARDLLEPWFGSGDLPSDLPLPALLEVEVDLNAPPVAARIEEALRRAGLDPQIDDHRRWAGNVTNAADALRAVAMVILALLATAAAATVSFAARAGLEARRDIVEALHLVGAQDRYISRLFENRFLGLGLKAGLLGAALAACSATGIVLWLQHSDSARLLIGKIPLSMPDLLALIPAPFAAGLIGMLTARASLVGALRRLE